MKNLVSLLGWLLFLSVITAIIPFFISKLFGGLSFTECTIISFGYYLIKNRFMLVAVFNSNK
jgi:hypothetical protein